MKIFGLTGGIASGKSTVAALLRAQDIPVVDADRLYHDLIKPHQGQPSALAQQISNEFKGVLHEDGTLNRPKLGGLIFNDAKARQRLNHITHPAVGQAFLRTCADYRARGQTALIYDVPLLYESKKEDEFEAVIVVWVPHTIQLQRLVLRDGITVAEAQARLSSQLSLDTKRQRAHHVIDNSGSPESTERQVNSLTSVFK